MKPPEFWHNDPRSPGLASRLLAPLGWAYARATAKRVATPASLVADVPVVCVGNINVGGTGKTPTVIALAQHLFEAGQRPHIVSRGYGARLKGPIRVDHAKHTAAAVGDEPLLLAAFAPVWVSDKRVAGVAAAQAAGASIVLLDDGLQDPSVQKNLSIVVVDAQRGFGNGRVLPAGPLREPVTTGLERANLLISIGDEAAQNRFSQFWGDQVSCPRIEGILNPLETGIDWHEFDLFAFAGIGHPEKFFSTLKQAGGNVVATEMLDDHQPLTPAIMHRLEMKARACAAQLVTTEKDAVRLPRDWQQKVLTMPVRLELKNRAPLDRALAALSANRD